MNHYYTDTTGTWFSPDKEYAKNYGKIVTKANLNVDKPLDFIPTDRYCQWDSLVGFCDDEDGNTVIDKVYGETTDDIAMEAEDLGYDGVDFHLDNFNGPEEIVVFDPDDIDIQRIIDTDIVDINELDDPKIVDYSQDDNQFHFDYWND